METKEQFSDGVGYSWIDTLREITAAAVSDEQMEHAAERFRLTLRSTRKNITTGVSLKSIFRVKAQAAAYQAYQVWPALQQKRWHGMWLSSLNEPSGRAVRVCMKHECEGKINLLKNFICLK